MIQRVRSLLTQYDHLSSLASPMSALVSRLVIGFVFIPSGWGKLLHLQRTIEYFQSIGIPTAAIQAPIAAATELVCGALVLFGLAGRLASVPLVGVMVVAIITAKWPETESAWELLDMSEFLYITLLLWIATNGPGNWSIDRFVTGSKQE